MDPKEKMEAEPEIEPKVLKELKPKVSCNKCGKGFADDYSLARHRTQRSKGCGGVWYVCQRCLEYFDKASAIKQHQAKTKQCQQRMFSDEDVHKRQPPKELVNKLRLRKGKDDAGSVEAYYNNVIARANKAEVVCVLEACDIKEFDVIFSIIEREASSANALTVVSILANFANEIDVSPEKSALIKRFVAHFTTL